MTDPLHRAGLAEAAAVARVAWRDEEDEWTRAALEYWQHRRTLLEVVRELMHRGDTIALALPSATFAGSVRGVGADIVVLDAADGRVDVRVDAHTPLVVRVLERARRGGTRGDGVTSFRARLLELETGECDVDVGTGTAVEVVRGRLQIGRDHVIVRPRGGTDTVIALAAISWVRPSPA